MQLGIRICLRSVPWPLLPEQIFQAWITALVEAGAEVYEALRLQDPSRQDIGSQRIDGKHMRKPILCFQTFRLAVPDCRVVNDRVEAAELIHLLSYRFCLGDTREITNSNRVGSRQL